MAKSIYQKLVDQYGFSPAQKTIISLVKEGEVFEIGSSAGYMTRELAKVGCQIDVLDIDQDALKDAKKFARKTIWGSVEDSKVQDKIRGQYDTVVCADVLEHLANPEKVLYFLKGRLKDSGQILISIPNIAFWDMRLELLKGRFEYKESGLLDKTHLRFYTYDSFLRLLKDIGYKIIKIYPAEGRIPFEHTLRKIPILGWTILKLIKPIMMRSFPNLTYYHYVVQAKI